METQSPLALLASVVSVLDFVKRDNISARRLERLSVTPRTDIYQDHQRRKQNLVGFTPQKVGTDQKIAGIFPCPSTMKWLVGQEQICPLPPPEQREGGCVGERWFGAAGNGLSQSTIRARWRRS
jgi:hypothetical protein